MIVSIAPVRTNWVGRTVIGLSCAGLAALLVLLLDSEPSLPLTVVAQPATVWQPEVVRPAVGDSSGEAPAIQEARSRSAQAPHATPPAAQPPTLPFRFLGRLDVEGATSLVLYGRGRTLTVQKLGSLDDEYVVDAMEESYLVLRHVPTGVSHTLELVSKQATATPAGSAAQTAPD